MCGAARETGVASSRGVQSASFRGISLRLCQAQLHSLLLPMQADGCGMFQKREDQVSDHLCICHVCQVFRCHPAYGGVQNDMRFTISSQSQHCSQAASTFWVNYFDFHFDVSAVVFRVDVIISMCFWVEVRLKQAPILHTTRAWRGAQPTPICLS